MVNPSAARTASVLLLVSLGVGCSPRGELAAPTVDGLSLDPDTSSTRVLDAPVCAEPDAVDPSGIWQGTTEDGQPWSVELARNGGDIVARTGSRSIVMTLCGRRLRGEWPSDRLPSSFALRITSDGCKLGGTVRWASGDVAYVSATRDGGCAAPDGEAPSGKPARPRAPRPAD